MPESHLEFPDETEDGGETIGTSLRRFIKSWRAELPQAAAARWASIFLTLHILTLQLSVFVSQTFLTGATIAYFTHLLRNHQAVSFPKVKLPLLLFCLATLNSLFWARDPLLGGFAVRKLVLFLALLLIANLIVSRRHLESVFRGVFFVSAVAALAGVAQFVIQYRMVHRLYPGQVYYFMTLTRIHGFMGHWMNFGGQQMLIFTALVAFLLRALPAERCGGSRKLYGLLLAVITISLVLNFTRGVWLGCLVATLYLVARWRPRALWAIPVLLAIVYLAAPSMIRRRVSLAFHPSDDPALAIRLEMWRAGLKMIQQHPWVGVGPNNIPLVYTLYLPPRTTPMVGYHDHLHNDFLQIAAERGVPCLLIWLWFMLVLGWQILRIRRRLSSQQWVADAAIAAWLAFLSEGLFEFNFGTFPVLMVFLFLVSAPFAAEQAERQAKESNTAGQADEA